MLAALVLAVSIAAGSNGGPLATHEGTVGADTITWRSRMIVDGPSRAPLRVPLPASIEVDLGNAAAERDATGAVVAVVVTTPGRVLVDITTREPLVLDDVALHPPLLADAIERVTLRGEGVRFRPHTSLALEQRIGLYAAADVDTRARKDVEDAFALAPNVSTPPMWLGPLTSNELRAIGLKGTLARNTSMTSIVATLVLAGVLVVLLVIGVRVLRRRAESERADRLIDAEWRTVVDDARS